MHAPSSLSLSFRSYGRGGAIDRHDYAQLVLPLRGQLEIEVTGRGARLDGTLAAFIAPGADHAQSADGENRFLVIDCLPGELGDDMAERVHRHAFVTLSPVARAMLDRVEQAEHVLPQLLDVLLEGRPLSLRLSALHAAVTARLDAAWTAETMAARLGIGASRLHALFRQELDCTPQAWLSDLRLQRAQEMLRHTDVPIAQLAMSTGYSEQSALTRAMQRVWQVTPSVYRRRYRQA